MKLFNGLAIFNSLCSGQDARSSYCDTNDLFLPDHAEKWDCPGVTGSLVPVGTECRLKCDAGFIETICKSAQGGNMLPITNSSDSKQSYHKCKRNGWKNQNGVNVQCKIDG